MEDLEVAHKSLTKFPELDTPDIVKKYTEPIPTVEDYKRAGTEGRLIAALPTVTGTVYKDPLKTEEVISKDLLEQPREEVSTGFIPTSEWKEGDDPVKEETAKEFGLYTFFRKRAHNLIWVMAALALVVFMPA